MITLRIGWEPINEQRGYLKFSISDTGIGIPKEKRKNLFNYLDPQNIKNLLNSQDHNTTTLAGTGLGISAKIIQEMGSKIDYISTEGEGSKFWFKILTYKSNPDQRLDSASSSFRKPIEYESEMNYPKPLQIDERKDQIDLGMNQAVQSPCSVAIETGKLYTTDEILDCFDENHSDGVSLNNQTFTYEDFMPFNRSVYSGGDSNVHSCGDPRMLYKERERRLSTLNLCKSKKKNQKKQISLRKSKSKLQEKNLSGDS
mmetsp:Transcript_4695/g.4387  ORF Transcript_4695/g.4387 Transcript_4695/m.4387 type:complete len:257 (+) Transcript_4695:627-1397(+)